MSCSEDCSDHGDCQDGKCECDTGWYSHSCGHSGYETWGRMWEVFIILYFVLFSLLLCLSVWKLYVSLKSSRWMGSRQYLQRVFRSPKHLALVFISTQASLRLLWLAVDPLRFRDAVSRVYDRLIFESAYPLIYSTFSCVLLVWGGLYQGVARKQVDHLRSLRRVLFIAMLLSFPVCISVSTVKGLRVNQSVFRIIGYSLICVGVVIITAGLVLFGRKLSNLAKELEERDIEEACLMSEICSASREAPGSKRRQNSIDDPPELTRWVSDLSSLHEVVVKLRTSSLQVRSMDEEELNESNFHAIWSVSSESAESGRRNGEGKVWSRLATFNASESHQSTLPRPSVQPSPPCTDAKKDYLVVMTRDDQAVLHQVLVMTTLSAIVGGVDIVVSIFFVLVPQSTVQPWVVLGSLYLTLSLEFFSSALVLLVFTTNIRVKEKERLEHLVKVRRTQVAEHNRDASIMMGVDLPRIGRKLQQFIGAE